MNTHFSNFRGLLVGLATTVLLNAGASGGTLDLFRGSMGPSF